MPSRVGGISSNNMMVASRKYVFLMGMVEATGLGWEGRNLQAKLVAHYLYQLQQCAPSAQAFAHTKKVRAGQRLDGGYHYLQLERMAYYVNKDQYLKALHQHLRELQQDMTVDAGSA